MTTVASAMSAKAASCAASAPDSPSSWTSETVPRLGASALHQGMFAEPASEPTMKKMSVTTMRPEPPPTVKRVPEAQPPPSCMPMPNRKAPTSTETPAGASAPPTGRPNRLPSAKIGRKTTLASASMSIWARRPAPRPSATNARQWAAKPKTAW